MRVAFIAVLSVGVALPAAGQSTTREIRDSQLRLEQIKQEKLKLEQEMTALRSRMRDASRELTNIEKQRITQGNALRELDFQADLLNENVEETTMQRTYTQTQLIERKVALNQRLRSIYKLGPLHTVRVLLEAEDFGKLISRYKYLQMVTLYERMLVEQVSRLENALTLQEAELRENLLQLDRLREEKERELERLQEIENQRERTLQQYQRTVRTTQGRIDELTKDEAAVANVIAALERARREEENRAPGARPAEGTLTTRDLGALNWPVEGQLAFRFGPERKPNGVVLHSKGIGISAPVGTPVKSVEAGTVEFAAPLEGNGLTVMIDHGAGAYTIYLRLKSMYVKKGQKVPAGYAIGSVGGEGTPQGPHLEFQVRMMVNNKPDAVDPLDWLRSR